MLYLFKSQFSPVELICLCEIDKVFMTADIILHLLDKLYLVNRRVDV